MMRIREWNIENQSIKVEHINLDFAARGIYRLCGENGCGKTTLIERILFGEGAEFDSPEEERLYRGERYKLFSYCPQKIVQNSLSVKTYLEKGNCLIDFKRMEELFSEFGFEKTILQQKFDYLSGGEQMKLSVICTLLKETPYVILDEPSNYMDDASSKVLRHLLISEAEKRCVILVSHDERLYAEEEVEYLYEDGTIVLQNPGDGSICRKDGTEKKEHTEECHRIENAGTIRHRVASVGIFRLFGIFAKNATLLFTLIMAAALMIMMLWQTETELREDASEIEYPAEGCIIVQPLGFPDEGNELYRQAVGISVQEGCEERNILYTDVPDLAKLPGVERIFLYAEGSYLINANNYSNDTTSLQNQDMETRYNPREELFPVAFPQAVQQSGGGVTPDYLRLLAGRPPRDDAHEIAVSLEMLAQCLGYENMPFDEVIGRVIDITLPGEEQAVSYRVVGITAQPFELISYEEGMRYGGYWYDETDFEEFLAAEAEGFLLSGMKEDEIWETGFEMLFFIDGNAEQQILKYLLSHYPYSLFASCNVVSVLNRTRLHRAGMALLWKNLAAALLMFGILFGICRSSMRYNTGMLWDVGNYYLNRRKLYKQYLGVVFGGCLVVILCVAVWNIFRTHYVFWTSVYALLYGLSLLSAIALSAVFGRRRAVQEYGIEI